MKKEALDIIYIRLTFDGCFQRAGIYSLRATEGEKRRFRFYIASCLPQILSKIQHTENYSDKHHFSMIEKFAADITKKYSHILKDDKLRIGNAQKFINLYWKVRWLLKPGTRKPIHCPFDSIIIGLLGRKAGPSSWTKLESIKGYRRWVEVAREKAGKGRSIAEWELEEYIKKVNYRERLV